MLLRLVYASRMYAPIDVEQVAKAAAVANASKGITGLLLCDGEFFLQVLEGPRNVVSELFLKIARDPRHSGVQLVEASEVPALSYPNWGMGVIADVRKSATIWLDATAGRLDPFNMPARLIQDFIRAASFELLSLEERAKDLTR